MGQDLRSVSKEVVGSLMKVSMALALANRIRRISVFVVIV